MKVEYTPAAVSQLYEISAYIRERNPRAAVRVAIAIEAAATALSTIPFVGRQQDVEGVRKKIVASTRYMIFYKVLASQDVVRVLAIAHAKQQRPYEDA